MAEDQHTHVGRHLSNVAKGLPEIAAFGTRWLRHRTLAYRKLPSVELRSPSNVYTLHYDAEQTPFESSKVGLSDQRDALGQRKLRVSWRVSPDDCERISRSLELVAAEIGRTSAAEFRHPRGALEEHVLAQASVGSHHIGTTRMAADPANGVVDRNCRVHGVTNLFVAGPSTFPTASFANPVLTTAALAIRLADELRNSDRLPDRDKDEGSVVVLLGRLARRIRPHRG